MIATRAADQGFKSIGAGNIPSGSVAPVNARCCSTILPHFVTPTCPQHSWRVLDSSSRAAACSHDPLLLAAATLIIRGSMPHSTGNLTDCAAWKSEKGSTVSWPITTAPMASIGWTTARSGKHRRSISVGAGDASTARFTFRLVESGGIVAMVRLVPPPPAAISGTRFGGRLAADARLSHDFRTKSRLKSRFLRGAPPQGAQAPAKIGRKRRGRST